MILVVITLAQKSQNNDSPFYSVGDAKGGHKNSYYKCIAKDKFEAFLVATKIIK